MGLFTKKVNFVSTILLMLPLAYSKEEEVYNFTVAYPGEGPGPLRLFLDKKNEARRAEENFFRDRAPLLI